MRKDTSFDSTVFADGRPEETTRLDDPATAHADAFDLLRASEELRRRGLLARELAGSVRMTSRDMVTRLKEQIVEGRRRMARSKET